MSQSTKRADVALAAHSMLGRDRILMLVPHDPDDDPRIGWVASICTEFAPTDVIGVTWSNRAPVREYAADLYTERIAPLELASWESRATWRLGTWLGSRSAARTFATRAAAPDPADTRAFRDAVGSGLRFVGSWGYYVPMVDALYRAARGLSVPPKLIICHDFLGLLAGVAVGRTVNAPILYDAHEYTPEADLLAPRWESSLVAAVEARLVRRCDRVITVSPPLARHIERKYGLRQVGVVPNAEPLHTDVVSSYERERHDRVVFLVQGRASPRRGFESLLRGWELLDDPRAELVLRCPQTPYLEELRARFHRLFATGSARFAEAVPEAELVSSAAEADVGIIPYDGTSLNHRYACPNKLSQYMQAGLAILTTPLEFVRETVTSGDCGMVYDPARPDTFVSAARTLIDDPALLDRFKRAARTVAVETFNWEHQSQPYRQAIGDLLATTGR